MSLIALGAPALPDSTVGVDSWGVIPGVIPAMRVDKHRTRSPRPIIDVDIVIPAFNEADRLPQTLVRTVEFLEEQSWTSRIVVVDNGSVDDTASVAQPCASGRVQVDVVGCSRPGKGAAIRRGLSVGTSRFVGFFDADMATPVETLTSAMEFLFEGAAAVIASRHAPGATFVQRQPVRRRVGGAAFRWLARSLVRGVHDTQCGFKFFERAAVERALAQCRLSNFAFDAELLAHLQRSGGRIIEVPVAWTDDLRSTFHPVRDGIPAFAALLQLKRSVLL